MQKAYKDNFNETRQAIAKRILNNPLAAYIGYPGENSECRRAELQQVADGTDTSSSSFSFIRLSEFRRGDTNCSLDIGFETSSRYFDFEPRVDAEGNEWSQYNLKFSVNHPCHGSSDPSTTLARLKLWHDVAMLAAELQAEFCGWGNSREIWKMTKTAAQALEQKALLEKQQVDRNVRNLIDANRRAMRVGSERVIGSELLKKNEIPLGTFSAEFGELDDVKKYSLIANPECGACLTRVA